MSDKWELFLKYEENFIGIVGARHGASQSKKSDRHPSGVGGKGRPGSRWEMSSGYDLRLWTTSE